MVNSIKCFLIIVSMVISPLVFSAEKDLPLKWKDKPLYELGVTSATLNLPDYPGADQGRTRFVVLPYGFYRGKIFQADQDGGLRGRFVDKGLFEIDISLGAAFPADSSENKAREDMPDLDWIGEIGPRVIVHFIDSPVWGELDLGLPVRAVFSSNFKRLDYRGYLYDPTLDYRYRGFIHSKTNLRIRTGLIFASRQVAEYFYEVKPKYARAGRPVYEAKSGFFGSRIGLAITQRFGKTFWIVAATGIDNYAGTSNRHSPLLRKTTTQSYIFGLAWTFYESEQRAEDRW